MNIFKTSCLIGLVVLQTGSFLFAQSNKDIYHANSYRLDLPDSWMKPKMLKAITHVLPLAIDELKGRQFCTSGTADYRVELFIDSVNVSNESTSAPMEKGSGMRKSFYYTYSFTYQFYGALMVTDSVGKGVSLLKLVDSKELFDFSKEYNLAGQNGVYEVQDVTDTSGKIVSRRIVESAPPIPTDIPKHSASNVLSTGDFAAICEKRLYEVNKLLKEKD